MKIISDLYKDENERLHRALFGVHQYIYTNALGCVKDALMTLHRIEVMHADARTECKGLITEFETLRGNLEWVGDVATKLNQRILRENGCNGKCSRPPSEDGT